MKTYLDFNLIIQEVHNYLKNIKRKKYLETSNLWIIAHVFPSLVVFSAAEIFL